MGTEIFGQFWPQLLAFTLDVLVRTVNFAVADKEISLEAETK